ncbi:MAG TPA: hypothetical protein VH641_20515 [Streptosporangiaceae bacterium]|jgi:hypothetical protein
MTLYDSDSITMAIGQSFNSPHERVADGEPANVVDGLFAIARSIEELTAAVTKIAHGGVEEPGGLEALSMTINGGHGGDWPSVTGAIREGFETLAEAIRDTQP